MKRLSSKVLTLAMALTIALVFVLPASANSDFTESVRNIFAISSEQVVEPAESSVLRPPTVTGVPSVQASPSTTPQPTLQTPAPGQQVWRPAPVETYVQPPAALYRPAPVYRAPIDQAPVAQRPVYAPLSVYRPAIALTPMPKTYTVGRGALGQPKVYVPAQPVRNVLRWISP